MKSGKIHDLTPGVPLAASQAEGLVAPDKEILAGGSYMELDVNIDGRSLSIPMEDPFRIDLEDTMRKIEAFASSGKSVLDGLDIRGLIPLMIKGIAGCERGCPADAKGVVSTGYAKFELQYIEGGILSAKAFTADGKTLHLKMFPDF